MSDVTPSSETAGSVQDVEILPRAPLTLTLVGDAGVSCEGDSCSF